MPRFNVGQTERTPEPRVVVDPPHAPGTHRYQVIAIDELGQQSAPVVITITIRLL